MSASTQRDSTVTAREVGGEPRGDRADREVDPGARSHLRPHPCGGTGRGQAAVLLAQIQAKEADLDALVDLNRHLDECAERIERENDDE